MASLQNAQIDQTYPALIKTEDNGPIGAAYKQLTDGAGNTIPIEVSNTEVRILSNGIQLTDVAQANGFAINNVNTAFGGPVDFSAATVTGLPVDPNTTYDLDAVQNGANVELDLNGSDATQSTVTLTAGTNITLTNDANNNVTIDAAGGGGGAAGLESGTGTGSMQSAASLTSIAANANGTNSISLGNNSTAFNPSNIAIGDGANCSAQSDGIAIGTGANGYASNMIAIGENATTGAAGYRNIAIGLDATTSSGTDCIAIGKGTSVTASNGCAIGEDSSATASGAVAIGNLITAATANTVSVKALETQTDSTPTAGGIIMSDAGGTDRRINIDAAGGLQIDSTPVGGASDFKVKTTTQVTNTTTGADETLVSLLIPANTLSAGSLIDLYAHVAMNFGGGGSIYFNAGLGPAVNTNIMQVGTGGFGVGAGVSTKRTVAVHVANGTGLGSSTPGIDINSRGNAYPMNGYTFPDNDSQALDWTSDMYLNIYVYVDNAGSSATLMSAYVKEV